MNNVGGDCIAVMTAAVEDAYDPAGKTRCAGVRVDGELISTTQWPAAHDFGLRVGRPIWKAGEALQAVQ